MSHTISRYFCHEKCDEFELLELTFVTKVG